MTRCRPLAPHRSRSRRSGQALFTSITFVGIILGICMTLVVVTQTNAARVAGNRQNEQLLNAARAGQAQTRLALWDAYCAGQPGGKPGNAASYRTFLDGKGLTAGTPGPTVTLPALSFNPAAAGGGMTGATVTRTAYRQDDGATSTYVVMSSVARDANGDSHVAEEVLRIGGKPYEGFRFALLANNVNCIFCHARFDNVTRYYGNKDGSHQRVKVASLETLMLRNDPDSTIAGTLYVQGTLMTKDGTPLAVPPGGSGKLQAEDIDSQGKILDPSSVVNFVGAAKDAGGNFTEQFANFYRGYSTDPTKQIDGPMPATFPPVVNDANGNRTIDGGEWSVKAGSMTGTLTGGRKVAVPVGSTYAGGALPSVDSAGTYSSNTPGTHMVLVGTESDPIVIDGDVAIDGDVVISGYVKGTGLLLARRNLYIVGDIKYADGTDGVGKRTFGVASDGAENTMAFAAGGNVVHGAYNTDKSGNLLTETSGGFTMNEVALFNRMEWTKTQPYFDAATGFPTATDTGVPNSAYVAGHVPRYYSLGESVTQVQMFAPAADVQWDNTNKVWVGKEHGDSYTAIPLTGAAGTDYVLKPLNPAGDWISQANMRSIHTSADAARPPSPYEVDGLLYTDNAIMMLARSSSSSSGQAIVNGAIISADAGILVPGDKNSMSGFDTFDEGKKFNGTSKFDEAAFGFDVNGDGDTNDSPTYADIWANRASWPLNSTNKWSTFMKTSSGKYQMDINMDGDYSDKVTVPTPPGAGNFGLQLNYDVNTRRYLVIEDPTSVQVYAVTRRER